jgi:hypothetical protein
MQLSSIEQWLQKLRPAAREKVWKAHGSSRRKQSAPAKQAAQTRKKNAAGKRKGCDLLDLLAEVKAEDMLGTKI